MGEMLSPELYEEIVNEAVARHRRWERASLGLAVAGMPSAETYLDFWVAQVALERGRDWSPDDADRESDFVLDASDRQILGDMRARGECPECTARKMDEIIKRALP